MFARLNEVMVMGYLGNDAQLHVSENGKEFMTFSLAIPGGKDKDGNEMAPTWAYCISWRPAIAQYLKKGKQIIVKGSLSSYEKIIDEKKYGFMSVNVDSVIFTSWNEKGKDTSTDSTLSEWQNGNSAF